MAVSAMNHFTVLTDDVERTVDFYGDLLGLDGGCRDRILDFPGAWLYAGGTAILHVVGGRPREQLKPGVIDHMAFSAQGSGHARAARRTRHQVRVPPAGRRPACGRFSSSTPTARASSSTSIRATEPVTSSAR